MKKGTLALLLLLAAAACGGGLYLLNRPAAAPSFPETQALYLLNRNEEEIDALALRPRQGIAYPLVRTESGMRLLGQEDTPLREDVVEDLVGAAAQLEAHEKVADTAAEAVDLSDFGLKDPQLRLTVTYTDGTRTELLLGDEVQHGEETLYYSMRSGDSWIYTVYSGLCEPFFHEAEYLRAFDQPKLQGDLLDRVEVSGAVELSLVYADGAWRMEAPWRYPAAQEKMDALLRQIETMAFEACLGEAERFNLADYGLAQPALTVTLTQAPSTITGQTAQGETVSYAVPEKKYRLLLGNETGKSGVYLLWENKLFKASNFLLGFWKSLSPDDFLLRNPVNYQTNNLEELALSWPEEKKAYTLRLVESVTENNEIAVDEYGETLYEVEIYRASGEKLDATEFFAWYTALANTAPAGRLPEGYAPAGEKQLELTLTGRTGERSVALYAYDKLHSALGVDGTYIFYMDSAFLSRLLAAP